MIRLLRSKKIMGALMAFVLLAGTASTVDAAPSPKSKHGQTPPASDMVSGQEQKPEVEPGSADAEKTEALGPTKDIKVDKKGDPQAQSFSALAGSVANVDFDNFLNYCYKNLAYTKVKNSTGSTKYAKIRVYNKGSYREQYVTISANTTSYPAFYGVEGNYTAYLYVWNGSYYQYDEHKYSENTCKVDVTRIYNSGGWVRLQIENNGTAYATQKSTELAPYPNNGTYTGTHYNYPAIGGSALYRWFYVGTSPYGIVSETVGSSNSPALFYGDL